MVEPIKHTTTSSVSTTGWETVKGAGTGLGVFLAVPAALAGGIALIAGASGGAAALWAIGAAAAAGIAGAPILAAFTAVGALFGLAKGGDQITRENQKVRQRVEQRQHTRQNQLATASAAGMQDGYQVGFEEGKNYVVNQLRAAQEQMLMAQAQQQEAAKGGHADKIMKQREAQAAATPQVG